MPDSLRAFVAVTDNDWFRFLSAREGLGEVDSCQVTYPAEARDLSAHRNQVEATYGWMKIAQRGSGRTSPWSRDA